MGNFFNNGPKILKLIVYINIHLKNFLMIWKLHTGTLEFFSEHL